MDHDFLQSGEVLLEITKSEYQNEFNRASVLDTKIGITLPVIATYFFLLLSLIHIYTGTLCPGCIKWNGNSRVRGSSGESGYGQPIRSIFKRYVCHYESAEGKRCILRNP